ncbi:hypothetical protein [Agrococcus sp. DT81.2]|uniref:hypothetical protein n=1 Tax=Agrococcus sp. DT81.2 TaxID=3393414 RepID=UPI003CE4A92E
MSEQFCGLEADALRERYGDFYEVRVGPLDPAPVPEPVRDLVPYAEVWGLGDDVERDELVEAAPAEARDDLLSIFSTRGGELEDWLAGPAADGPEYSAEYVAFVNMMMAYEYLSVLD